jgi:hypothetical protein
MGLGVRRKGVQEFNVAEVVESQKILISVIPAQAGIKAIQSIAKSLDTGPYRCDAFLRAHQTLNLELSTEY